MAAIKHEITLGSHTLPILFGSNALKRIEEATGRSIPQLGYILVNGLGTWGQMQAILWGGLEGGRLKSRTRVEPFTLDEVGDLIDEAGGPAELWGEGGMENPEVQKLLEAWRSAFPQKMRADIEAAAKQVEASSPNGDAAS